MPWMLEYRETYNDGSCTAWKTATVAGKPEIWHEYSKAVESAEKRNYASLGDVEWRVAGDDRW